MSDKGKRVRHDPRTSRPAIPAVLRIIQEALESERHKYAWDASLARLSKSAADRPHFGRSLKKYDDLSHAILIVEALRKNPTEFARFLSDLESPQLRLPIKTNNQNRRQ